MVMSKINEDINRIKEVMYEMKTVSKERLVLNFPNLNSWERVGSKVAKMAGLVSDIFKTVEDAETWLAKNHHTLSKPLDTLIFGTHGSMLSGHIMGIYNEWDLFKTVKSYGLVGSNTLVFFTACEGANKVFRLMEVANYFGVPVYAADGTYNYVTNSADMFIKVEPQDITKPVSEYNENNPNYVSRDIATYNEHGKKQLDFALRRSYVTEIPSSPITWL